MLYVYKIGSKALFFCALIVLSQSTQSTLAQQAVQFSGEVFADYLYQFSALDSDRDGENRFTYRRARLTADADLSDQFSARLRLEANDLTGTARGVPTPFVKDVYLKWKDAIGKGHNIVMGMQAPPAWQPAEKFWGYRSVSKTLQDRVGVHSSRDMGVHLSGPLLADGKVKYGVMLGNANSVRAENNKYKRIYGSLEFYPSDSFTASVGSNYQLTEGGYAWNLSGFAGFKAAKFRVGAEGFFHPVKFEDISETQDWAGVSGFVVVDVFENNSVMARAAYVKRPEEGLLTDSFYAVLGFAFKPHDKVQFIPNVIFLDLDGVENTSVTGRMTLWLKF